MATMSRAKSAPWATPIWGLGLGGKDSFASKGAFLAQVDPSQKRGYRTVTSGIVP